MMIKDKSVEYYFDSKKYKKEQVIENMKKEQLGFEKKKAEIDIKLNQYGIYVATLKFENNKISIINTKIENAKNKLLDINNKISIIKSKLPAIKDKMIKIKEKLPLLEDKMIKIKEKLLVVKNKTTLRNDGITEIVYNKNEVKTIKKLIKENKHYGIYNN